MWHFFVFGKFTTIFYLCRNNKNGITTMINSVQMELLSAMSGLNSQEDLLSLKRFLVAFFAQRVDAGMDALWESGEWNEKTLKDLSTAHSRTAYK